MYEERYLYKGGDNVHHIIKSITSPLHQHFIAGTIASPKHAFINLVSNATVFGIHLELGDGWKKES